MPQHRLGDFKIRDDAVFQRPDRHDIARGAPEHPLGLVAHGEHLAGAGLHGDDRGLAQHDAVVFYVYQRIRRAEVDADVIGKQPEKSVKH